VLIRSQLTNLFKKREGVSVIKMFKLIYCFMFGHNTVPLDGGYSQNGYIRWYCNRCKEVEYQKYVL